MDIIPNILQIPIKEKGPNQIIDISPFTSSNQLFKKK